MMSGEFAAALPVLIVYLAAVLIYTAAEACSRGKISAAAKAAFALAVPVAGLLILV